MKEDLAQEHIQELENRIRRILLERTNLHTNDLENVVNLLMYEALVYSAHYHHINEEVVLNMSWEYFEKAKNELLTKIP